jgi:DNA-binding transcriptional MerR regulator
MENHLTIGQFAEAADLSPKALRLYAANGLLTPSHTDGESGYRYYRPEQLRTARAIGLLRTAGMSLREIRRVLVDADPTAIERYEARLERELAERREALRTVRLMFEEGSMFEVEVHRVPAQKYVSRTKHVRIEELEPFILETIRELRAGATGAPFAVYHGEVNEQSNGPVEVGVPRDDGDHELPAGEIAVTTAEGEQCDFPQVLGAYDAITRWASEHGRTLECSPREVYLSGDDEPLRMQIAWPLG